MTICVVCHRVKGHPDNTDPDLCSPECRDDWEASLSIEVDPDVQCGTVDGTNGHHRVYVPPSDTAIQREEAAWRYAMEHGSVNMGVMRGLYPELSTEALRQNLRTLYGAGFLDRHGTKRGTYYTPRRYMDGRMEHRDVMPTEGVKAAIRG